MFTGIVQCKLALQAVENSLDFATFHFDFPPALRDGLVIGASVAINGTCLTVRAIEEQRISFDAIGQTLRVTNLGMLQSGDWVNIERAARFGDEIGGHLLSGHIMTQVPVVALDRSPNNVVVWMARLPSLVPYLLDKGYVALNGCSLTIAELESDRFAVHLIPETLSVTTFGDVQVGTSINVEVDPQTQAVVDTVERIMRTRTQE